MLILRNTPVNKIFSDFISINENNILYIINYTKLTSYLTKVINLLNVKIYSLRGVK